MTQTDTASPKKILFVDDEHHILKALHRLFLESVYEVFTAESGQAALDILENEKINLVITDMMMPGMDGYQLLCKVKERYPEVLRVMLSGYADEKIIFNALQRSITKLYIFKPWDNQKLLTLIDQIFETEEILNNSALRVLINNIEELPTINSTYRQILSFIDNEAEIAQIASEIERDPSIASRVLHIANSAFFGIATGSIKHAVTYLGLSNIRNLLLSTSVIDALSVNGIYKNEIELLWKHSFLCNKIVHIIYEKLLNKKLSESELSAGLLHNIGIVFLLKYFPAKYLEADGTAGTENDPGLTAKEEQFNVTHQQAGGYLLKWWELPYPIVEATLYHHTPFDTNIINRKLVCAVHIAQYYASVLLKKKPSETLDYRVFELLEITVESFEKAIAGLQIN